MISLDIPTRYNNAWLVTPGVQVYVCVYLCVPVYTCVEGYLGYLLVTKDTVCL